MKARGGGSLIFTSTFVGHTAGMPGMAAYAASKAGLIGLTQVLAAEFGADGIRVNAILPGGTDTPMGRTVADTPETTAFVENLHAIKRNRGAGRDRPVRALPGVGRIEFHDRHRDAGRRRRLDLPHMTVFRTKRRVSRGYRAGMFS